jgi:hypothetical protein
MDLILPSYSARLISIDPGAELCHRGIIRKEEQYAVGFGTQYRKAGLPPLIFIDIGCDAHPQDQRWIDPVWPRLDTKLLKGRLSCLA